MEKLCDTFCFDWLEIVLMQQGLPLENGMKLFYLCGMIGFILELTQGVFACLWSSAQDSENALLPYISNKTLVDWQQFSLLYLSSILLLFI